MRAFDHVGPCWRTRVGRMVPGTDTPNLRGIMESKHEIGERVDRGQTKTSAEPLKTNRFAVTGVVEGEPADDTLLAG